MCARKAFPDDFLRTGKSLDSEVLSNGTHPPTCAFLNELRRIPEKERDQIDKEARWRGKLRGKWLDGRVETAKETVRIRAEEKKGYRRTWRRETAYHPTDEGPENRETIQSAADAANCPLIIRTREDARRVGANTGWRARLPLSFSSNEGRRMKYSSLIRCNCSALLENSPSPALFSLAPFPAAYFPFSCTRGRPATSKGYTTSQDDIGVFILPRQLQSRSD